MKKTFYTLKNKSGSEGTYFIDGDYKSLFPGQEITLEKMPVNKTANITIVIYRKEVFSNVPLATKPKTVVIPKVIDVKTENKNTENKNTENKNTENKNTENKNTENKNTENKNIGNKNIGNKNTENEVDKILKEESKE